MRCFNMQAKKHKTTLWSRSLVSVTKKPRTCWTVASSTPALRNSAKIAFKKICSCNEAFLSQKTNETKTRLWSSESMKHQEEVWKGKSLAAIYLNTGWAVYLTIGCFITACNSGIITFFGEKLVQWKGHRSKGNIFTWLHWHMVMRTFHLWLQSRGPSWQSRGLFSAWPTRRSPWPSCRCPGTAVRPPTALPPARECHTCGTTLPNAGDRAEQQPNNRQTNPKHPEHPVQELWTTLLQSQMLKDKAYWPKPTEATLHISHTPTLIWSSSIQGWTFFCNTEVRG